MTSSFSQQDIDGCNYTMSIIMNYENRIISWTHTPGEFDKYDMDWLCESKYEGTPNYHCQDENKDRRWAWKIENGVAVRDYDKPQYISSFSSQMFNYDKYEPMMERYKETGMKPIYTAGYQDGVWICDLRNLPTELIYKNEEEGGWKVKRPIRARTMDSDAPKKRQDRFLIPNNYGKILYKC